MPDWRQFFPPRDFVVRFFKYAFLLLALAINTKLVFDGFSYYLARRALDTELESKKSSLEYLNVLTKRDRAFLVDTIETRCAQRNELAVFRILDAEKRKKLDEAYAISVEVKDKLVALIDELIKNNDAVAAAVNLPELKKELNEQTLELARLEQLPKPPAGLQQSDPRFVQGSREIVIRLRKAAAPHVAELDKYAEIRRQAEAKLDTKGPRFERIEALESRYKRFTEARKQAKSKLDDLDDVLSRYAVWTAALLGGTGDNPVLDEAAFDLSRDNQQRLTKIDCERFELYFRRVTGEPIRPDRLPPKMECKRQSPAAPCSDEHPAKANEGTPRPDTATPPTDQLPAKKKDDALQRSTDSSSGTGAWTIKAAWDGIRGFYRSAIYDFFSIPPVAQTLFVTLVLGALGALTINALRLSKVGYWGSQRDPLWGELLLCPFLGSLAAFGIFLLGSAGLLLTGDAKGSGSGATALSPFFIGTLGFISGLLYDDAFGRVRRFGATYFGGDGPAVTVSAEDRSLAEALRNDKAAFVADLVLKFGIGKRISAEPEFTLLVPSDEAMSRLTLQAWKEISEPTTRPSFENWFRRHHALKRVTTANVAANTVTEVQMEDGTVKYPLAVVEGVLTVNKIKVAKADINWSNGVIHIMKEDVA